MNADSSNIAESLQKLVKQGEFSVRVTKWSIVVLIALLPVMGGIGLYRYTRPAAPSEKSPLDWYDVTASRRQCDLQKALKEANELLSKNPRDFDGLYQKGEILLMLGDKDGARKSFQEAADIFPIYKYKSAVDALKGS